MHKAPHDADHIVLRNTKLKALRLGRNLTQQHVADSLDVDASTLCRWEENEEKINLGNLRKLADFYEVPVEWLISPDPMVLNMHDNEMANGAYNTVNVMPKEMLEQMAAQHNAHIEALHKLTDRLMDLTERMFNRFGG
jgi:transcriptional regulator with XRE-family HTH domain